MTATWPLKTQLSIDQSTPGHTGYSLPREEVSSYEIKNSLKRKSVLNLPEMSELAVVRHFTRLSYLNYSIDGGAYPLGSCTMKYNPRVNEYTASLFGLQHLHPLTPQELCQGALELMFNLENLLGEISGFSRVSLQPAAGAQGEYAGIRMIRAYLEEKNEKKKTKILIPDSAHGTNPATAVLCGFEPVEIKSNDLGLLDLQLIDELTKKGDVAAIMLTNPNTLGLFETEVQEICKLIHERDGLVYCDGANLNAMLGLTRPGDAGVDVMHFNLHKTFTTPHGGGGPGCGGVGVSSTLRPYLPTPTVEKNLKNADQYLLDYKNKKSIGKIKDFYGHFLMMVRAYTYIRELGPEGMKKVSEDAILLANYVRKRLEPYYEVAFNRPCMHEVVLTDKKQQANGIKTFDIAKRLIDYGYHPPTVYFPLLVPGAIMIEPTETESLDSVELFCQAMIQIAKEAEEEGAKEKYFQNAPSESPIARVDETLAARQLVLTWSQRK